MSSISQQSTVHSTWTESFSILVVSTQKLCNRLKLSMTNASDKYFKGEIIIKLAENVEDILTSVQPDTLADYVALVIDTTLPSNLDIVEKNLALLDPNFVDTRICIVNGTPFSGSLAAAKDLTLMADNFNIPYINGEIMDNAGCKLTSERILRLAASTTGLSKTGVPVIVPTPKDLFLL